MRTVELAKIAAAAEALRLRRIARRQAMRAAYGAGAAVFGLAVLVVLHFLLFIVLDRFVGPIVAVLIVLAIDAVAAGVLASLAFSSKPDPIEVEAKQVRLAATHELKRSLTVMGMAAEVAGVVLRSGARRGARRGFGAAAAGLAGRLIGR